MSYQAVVRDPGGELVKSSSISMKISILQDSETGTAIYVETQTKTTNENGLVTLEIGSGSVVTGTFPGIDWSTGLYFLKTETDPAGGTDYTITGTCQLLSVPYAMYAETAGSTNGKSGHYIGESFGGGLVFWVDQSGQHGLICSMTDLSASQIWSDVATTLIGATAQSDWDGQGNTNAIVEQSITTSAADLCDSYINADYGTGIFSDWYLPSLDQFKLLFYARYMLNKFLDTDGNSNTTAIVKNFYWSSSEQNSTLAWEFDFGYGYFNDYDKSGTDYVRAVRSF